MEQNNENEPIDSEVTNKETQINEETQETDDKDSAINISDVKIKPLIVSDLASSVFEWIELIVFAFTFVLIVMMLAFRHSPVVGSSMAHTLEEKDVLILSELTYKPKNGDIIVFQSNIFGYEEPLVKRIIAKGGQELNIDFENWVVTVDGVELDEDYVNRESGNMIAGYVSPNYTFPMIIPEGYLFVMGDNRRNSVDSRDKRIGLVDERFIIGHVVFRIFPLNKFGVVK